MKDRVLKYFQLKYPEGRYFDEEKILKGLSRSLRLEIYMKECRGLVIQVPFFTNASPEFIEEIVLRLKPVYYLPDDFVIEKGTADDCMYLIATGNLSVLYDNAEIAELKAGDFFGEVVMLFSNLKRTSTLKANSDCRLYSLSRHDLEEVLIDFPELSESLEKAAEKWLEIEIALEDKS